MRTAINASWIVGYENGAHTLIRDGTLVYEDNRIIHVGRGFDGRVDRTIEARERLVAPGFIDTHVHSGHRASHRLITDTGRPMYFGQPFLEIRSRASATSARTPPSSSARLRPRSWRSAT